MVKIMTFSELIGILSPLEIQSEEVSAVCVTEKELDSVIIEKASEVLHLDGVSNKNDVKEVLNFANENENVIVCCETGSYSSALAYLIECTEVNPAMAVNLWIKNQHKPDETVIKFGSEILKNPNVEKYYRKWMG